MPSRRGRPRARRPRPPEFVVLSGVATMRPRCRAVPVAMRPIAGLVATVLAAAACATKGEQTCPAVVTTLNLSIVDAATGVPLELAQVFVDDTEQTSIGGVWLCSTITDAGTDAGAPAGDALCGSRWE